MCETGTKDRRRITGVLYWHEKSLPLHNRILNFVTQLKQPTYLRYVADRLIRIAGNQCIQIGRFFLGAMHARFPKDDDFGIADLRQHCRTLDIPFHAANQLDGDDSLEFVAQGEPDMGIVCGTPILRPTLFEIPRLGSVNLHQRKIRDDRGSESIRSWELLDNEAEAGVTVHRVAEKPDVGVVIRRSTIPIEPFDTFVSLEMKAQVVGIDLLVAAVNDYASGSAYEMSQEDAGMVCRFPEPADMQGVARQLQGPGGCRKADRSYPLWKLFGRFIVLTPWLVIRNWYRRLTATFPVVVLYHHIVTDRPHFLGMSTDQFLNQMNFLRRHYNVVDLDAALQMLRAGRVTEPTIVLTLDDGYRDNVLSLRAAALDGDVPAMLYVCSEHIESRKLFRHDLERDYFGFEPMTWDEVRKMESWGYRFGAHTRTHFDCGSTDERQLYQEITRCRDEIEAQTGRAIDDFSFPFGLPPNISRKAFEIATGHYSVVASAYGGVNRAGQAGRGHVFRCPHPTSLLELELLLQSALVFGQPDFWAGREPAATKPAEPALEQPELIEV